MFFLRPFCRFCSISRVLRKMSSSVTNNSAIAVLSNMPGFRFINSRYGVFLRQFGFQEFSLHFVDLFHQQEREFEIVDNPFKNMRRYPNDPNDSSHPFHLEVVDQRHIFLVDTYRYSSVLNLLKLDYDEMKASFVCSGLVDIFTGIVFDEQNSNNFVVIGCSPSNCVMTGRIVDDKMEIKCVDIGEAGEATERSRHFKLVGDTLHVLHFYKKDENENGCFSCAYYETKPFTLPDVYRPTRPPVIVPLDKKSTKLFETEVGEPTEQWDLGSSNKQSIWIGSSLYMLRYINREMMQVWMFDIEQRKLTPTEIHFDEGSRVYGVYFEKDLSSLSIRLEDKEKEGKYVIHRYPLRRPEELVNTILFKTRREALFSKNDRPYKALMPVLAAKLKPFALDF